LGLWNVAQSVRGAYTEHEGSRGQPSSTRRRLLAGELRTGQEKLKGGTALGVGDPDD